MNTQEIQHAIASSLASSLTFTHEGKVVVSFPNKYTSTEQPRPGQSLSGGRTRSIYSILLKTLLPFSSRMTRGAQIFLAGRFNCGRWLRRKTSSKTIKRSPRV